MSSWLGFEEGMPSGSTRQANQTNNYGLKLFMAVDSETLSPLSILPHLERQTSVAAGGQGLGNYLVTEMNFKRFYDSVRNVTFIYMSLALARRLLQDHDCGDPNPD